jgi:tetratricopeptide (TPR) repeat protein
LEVLSASPAVKASGLSRLRRAHEINPNDAMSLAGLAHGETVCGNHVKGRELALDALRMSPRDPIRYAFTNTLALAHFLAKNYAAGLDWALRSVSEAPNYVSTHEHAAMNYVGLARIEEARRELEWVRKAAPEQTEMLLQKGQLHLADPEQRTRATLFFRIAAGLEDPSAADLLR